MYPSRVTTPPEPDSTGAQALTARPWVLGLLASLVIALLCAWPAVQMAFSSPFVAADDARQHIFWMGRFTNPHLFPGDPIADYFQGVAPAGYTGLYALLALLGVPPLFASKLVPIVLGLVATGFAYGLAIRLLNRPAAGVFAALLLNQHLWRHDDLASGTPRAFVTPLFLGFLYCLVKGSWTGTIAFVALLGLFYPQGLLLAMGTLVLRALWAPAGAEPRRGLCLAALGAGLTSMMPFVGASGRFGPTVGPELAAAWPEFQRGGRSVFFDPDPWRFWGLGDRSGLLPYFLSSSPVLLMGLVLPVFGALKARFPAVKEVRAEAVVLVQVVIASIVLFGAAHMMLFKLHLPSRYTMHTLWIVAAVAGGMAIAILLEALWTAARAGGARRWPAIAGLFLLVAGAILYPGANRTLGQVGYRPGAAPGLYAHVSKLDTNARIASISTEADFLPLFTGRSVLAAREFAIPYQLGYYQPFRERLLATMTAQYTRDSSVLRQFVLHYGVTHVLVDKSAFTPGYVSSHPLLKQYLASGLREALLHPGAPPVLQRAVPVATIYEDDRVILLDAAKATAWPSGR